MRLIVLLVTFLWISLALGQEQGVSEQLTPQEDRALMDDSLSNPNQPSIQEAVAGGAHSGSGIRQDDEAIDVVKSSESEGTTVKSDVNSGESESYSASGGGKGGHENQQDEDSGQELKGSRFPDSSKADSTGD